MISMRRRSFLSIAVGPLLAADERPISVLIVDGINNHDWQAGTEGIQSILRAAGLERRPGLERN